jgi:GDPmannose 4,6-dehydratase
MGTFLGVSARGGLGLSMTRTALITGITGQDGAYLAKYLLDKGYRVFGTYRRVSTPNFWRLQYLNILEKTDLLPADLIDSASVVEAIKVSEPDELYHLAAQSYVGASFEQPVGTGEITGLGVMRVLEAIRQVNPSIKLYQASTSELYGAGGSSSSTEETPFRPASPYAAAKLYGFWATRMYRQAYDIFASNGILFNHESPLRGLEFVTRKISNAVARISLGIAKDVRLGNLQAKRDWGYAPDYVESMWLMMQQKKPDDYVIATNESHSVADFAEKAFKVVGLNWRDYVKVDNRFLRPLDVEFLQGDYSKAREALGWKPRVTFDQLVQVMVKEDLERWNRWTRGDTFPWDAPLYTGEDRIISRYLRIDR